METENAIRHHFFLRNKFSKWEKHQKCYRFRQFLMVCILYKNHEWLFKMNLPNPLNWMQYGRCADGICMCLCVFVSIISPYAFLLAGKKFLFDLNEKNGCCSNEPKNYNFTVDRERRFLNLKHHTRTEFQHWASEPFMCSTYANILSYEYSEECSCSRFAFSIFSSTSTFNISSQHYFHWVW